MYLLFKNPFTEKKMFKRAKNFFHERKRDLFFIGIAFFAASQIVQQELVKRENKRIQAENDKNRHTGRKSRT